MVSWQVMIGIILGSFSLALLWSFRLYRQQRKTQRAAGFYRITAYSKHDTYPILIVIAIIFI